MRGKGSALSARREGMAVMRGDALDREWRELDRDGPESDE